jgi:hypothetical protein
MPNLLPFHHSLHLDTNRIVTKGEQSHYLVGWVREEGVKKRLPVGIYIMKLIGMEKRSIVEVGLGRMAPEGAQEVEVDRTMARQLRRKFLRRSLINWASEWARTGRV